MRRETRETAAPADFELGRPRAGRLTYHLCWEDDGPARGLVFVIPGFGADSNSDYSRGLRDHIARLGFVAVSVDYHCLGARPENGGSVSVVKGEHARLLGTAQLLGLKIANHNDVNEVTRVLGAHISAVAGALSVRGQIKPTRAEYQNFGVLQALDHLAVLGDLMARGPAFDQSAVVAFGSSHGGYIAHLMAKIAPRSLSAVFDNSSYVQPPHNFLGVGLGFEYRTQINGIAVECEVESGWTMADRNAANAYTRDADLFRDVGFVPHAKAMRAAAGGSAPLFRIVNAARDAISPPAGKQRQAHALAAAGFDVQLDIISEDAIDGVMFKRMAHGLDASLGKLFDHWSGQVGRREGALDCANASVVEYPCVDRLYRFTHSDKAPFITGEVRDLFPLQAVSA